MQHAFVFAGFGGQGLLFAAEALARAGLAAGREVLWIPSYGPEMRGGTASCSVIIADLPIGSPVVDRFDVAAVLNPPSLSRFADLVAPAGTLIVNDSLIEAAVGRRDCAVLRVPCTASARAAGSEQMTAVVAMGAAVGMTGVVEIEVARDALRGMVMRKHPETLAGNLEAFEVGLDAAMVESVTRAVATEMMATL